MNAGRAEWRRKQSLSSGNQCGRPPLIGRILINAGDLGGLQKEPRAISELVSRRHLASMADFWDARGPREKALVEAPATQEPLLPPE
jgi:hypothetical protein